MSISSAATAESGRMQLFFRVCAYLLLALFVQMMILNVVYILKGGTAVTHLPGALMFLIGLLTFAGGFSFFALWPAMLWHCVAVNRTTIPRRILWFVLVLFTLFVGTLIYYFVVIEAER